LCPEKKVNGVDETSWFKSGKLQWLWTMVNAVVVFFMIHPNRPKEAFLQFGGVEGKRGLRANQTT